MSGCASDQKIWCGVRAHSRRAGGGWYSPSYSTHRAHRTRSTPSKQNSASFWPEGLWVRIHTLRCTRSQGTREERQLPSFMWEAGCADLHTHTLFVRAHTRKTSWQSADNGTHVVRRGLHCTCVRLLFLCIHILGRATCFA